MHSPNHWTTKEFPKYYLDVYQWERKGEEIFFCFWLIMCQVLYICYFNSYNNSNHYYLHFADKEIKVGRSRQLPSGTHWTEEPGGLQSIGSHGVGHDWSSLARMRTLIYLVTTLCKVPFKILGKQCWTKQLQNLHSRKVDRQYTVM